MKKLLLTAKDARENVGKFYVDNLDDGEQVVRKIIRDREDNVWAYRHGYKSVILAWHSHDDDRELYAPLEIVKNPDRKIYTLREIMAIVLSAPFVLSFLFFYVVGIIFLYIGTLIRTGDVMKTLGSIKSYIDTGKLSFTGK